MANLESTKKKKVCQVENCTGKYHAKGLCIRHYTQVRKFGCIKRTQRDPNEFRFDGDDCYILLYDKNGNFKVETVIDKEDYEKVKGYKWCVTKGYVYTNMDSKSVSLSRFLLRPADELDAEHKDCNTLNNRQSNLREATRSQNMCNRGIQMNNTSGYKGVYFDKRRNTWYSELRYEGIKTFLGSYQDKADAAKAYDAKSTELLGEFAHTNF